MDPAVGSSPVSLIANQPLLMKPSGTTQAPKVHGQGVVSKLRLGLFIPKQNIHKK